MIRKSVVFLFSLIVCAILAQDFKQSSVRPVGDDGPAVKASINGPSGIAIDGKRFLYVLESFGNFIRRVDLTTGTISTIKTQIQLEAINTISVDAAGDLIITEFTADRVRKVHPQDGSVTLLSVGIRRKFSGDGGPAIDAGLSAPSSTVFDRAGNLFIVDMGNNRVRRVDAKTGIISTVAGNGEKNSEGDGGPALQAGLEYPNSVAIDNSGNVYIAQYGYGPDSHRIRRVDTTSGIIEIIAGLGKAGLHGDHGPALHASLQSPSDLMFDARGNLIVVDPVNDRVRRIDVQMRMITTIAGTVKGFAGDGGPAKDAKLNNPSSITFDAAGNLYIAEFVNNRVRRVDARTGNISTGAGNGLPKHVIMMM